MSGITVGKMARDLRLCELTPEIDADLIEITVDDINRPALQLAGFYEFFNAKRVQIIGNVEYAYLATLTPEEVSERVDKLFASGIPCLIFCRNHTPSEDTLSLARKHGVPLFITKRSTNEFALSVINYVARWLAPRITVHGVLVDVFGEGVLITGESGIGKSEAALELIKRGHRLVADDAVEIHKQDDETLIGTAPEVTKDFIELRGIGVIDVKTLFGLESVKSEQQIDVVINIEEWKKDKEYDRLGNGDQFVEYLGNKVLCYTLPLRPGRNLAVIVEAIAINYRQRTLGYSAVDELYRRVQKNMQKDIEE